MDLINKVSIAGHYPRVVGHSRQRRNNNNKVSCRLRGNTWLAGKKVKEPFMWLAQVQSCYKGNFLSILYQCIILPWRYWKSQSYRESRRIFGFLILSLEAEFFLFKVFWMKFYFYSSLSTFNAFLIWSLNNNNNNINNNNINNDDNNNKNNCYHNNYNNKVQGCNNRPFLAKSENKNNKVTFRLRGTATLHIVISVIVVLIESFSCSFAVQFETHLKKIIITTNIDDLDNC